MLSMAITILYVIIRFQGFLFTLCMATTSWNTGIQIQIRQWQAYTADSISARTISDLTTGCSSGCWLSNDETRHLYQLHHRGLVLAGLQQSVGVSSVTHPTLESSVGSSVLLAATPSLTWPLVMNLCSLTQFSRCLNLPLCSYDTLLFWKLQLSRYSCRW